MTPFLHGNTVEQGKPFTPQGVKTVPRGTTACLFALCYLYPTISPGTSNIVFLYSLQENILPRPIQVSMASKDENSKPGIERPRLDDSIPVRQMAVGSAFESLTEKEKRYAHHLAR